MVEDKSGRLSVYEPSLHSLKSHSIAFIIVKRWGKGSGLSYYKETKDRLSHAKRYRKTDKVSKPKRDVRNGKAVQSQGTHLDVAQDDHEAQLAHIFLRAPNPWRACS